MTDTSLSTASTAPESHRRFRPKVAIYAIGLWFLTVVIAIANAVFRETVIAPQVTELVAHVLSTITLIAMLLVVSYAYFTRWSFEHTRNELIGVGVLWFGLTVGFEFLFGHYVMRNTWASLFEQYNLLSGHVWVFVPLTVLIAPVVFGYYLRNR